MGKRKVGGVEIGGPIDFFLPWAIHLMIPYFDCFLIFIQSTIIKNQKDLVIDGKYYFICKVYVRIKKSKRKKPQTYSVHKGWEREPFDRKKHF